VSNDLLASFRNSCPGPHSFPWKTGDDAEALAPRSTTRWSTLGNNSPSCRSVVKQRSETDVNLPRTISSQLPRLPVALDFVFLSDISSSSSLNFGRLHVSTPHVYLAQQRNP
jgi:hypothetical protein